MKACGLSVPGRFSDPVGWATRPDRQRAHAGQWVKLLTISRARRAGASWIRDGQLDTFGRRRCRAVRGHGRQLAATDACRQRTPSSAPCQAPLRRGQHRHGRVPPPSGLARAPRWAATVTDRDRRAGLGRPRHFRVSGGAQLQPPRPAIESGRPPRRQSRSTDAGTRLGLRYARSCSTIGGSAPPVTGSFTGVLIDSSGAVRDTLAGPSRARQATGTAPPCRVARHIQTDTLRVTGHNVLDSGIRSPRVRIVVTGAARVRRPRRRRGRSPARGAWCRPRARPARSACCGWWRYSRIERREAAPAINPHQRADERYANRGRRGDVRRHAGVETDRASMCTRSATATGGHNAPHARARSGTALQWNRELRRQCSSRLYLQTGWWWW